MKKIVEWSKRLFLDNEIYIRAAALTFFTLSGIIPVCILFIFVEEILMVDSSVSEMAGDILPNINDSFDALCSYPEIRLDQLLVNYGIIGDISIGRPVVICIIIVCVYCFLNNLHGSFNYIWKAEDRTKDFWKCLGFNLKVSLITALIIMLSAVVYSHLSIPILQSILALLMMMVLIYLAYRWIPYGKHPHRLPSFIAAFIASFFLYFWSKLIPFVGEQLSAFQFNGISILLLIFWLYWGWFIVLIGARRCAYWSKRGIDYMREEVDGIAPVYRRHLHLLVASYIFRNAGIRRDGSSGLSHKDIREGILNFFPAGTAKSDDSFLPMILLDSIIEELIRRGVIQNYANTEEYRFGPNSHIDCKTFTVGDLLFRMSFTGGYDLKYPYCGMMRDVEDRLSSSLIEMYSGLDTRLVDMNWDSFSAAGRPFGFEEKRRQYESFKDTGIRRKLESIYLEELKHRSPSEIIEHIENSPETAIFEPNREYHIGIVRELTAKMQNEGRMSDFGKSSDEGESVGGEGLFRKIRQGFRELFTNR